MIRSKKKTKKKILLNSIPKKVDYDVYQVLQNQEKQLHNHDLALVKFLQIYESKKKHTEDEKLLYQYCNQLESVKNLLTYIKEQENESE
tara:strand:- start:272 stop:538 length:267 start_codon:yes stop_codon:yes gene_type:complete